MATSPTKKVVLITGASSGFGLTTSKLLAENGYRVFGTSRHPGNADDNTTKEFEMLELDVGSDQSVQSCVDALLKRTGSQLDVLINNAGFVTMGTIEEMSLDEAKMQLDTNLYGAFRMVKATLPIMRKQRSGQIINIGSIAGHIPVPFQGFYATSKFALEGFTEQLRLEVENFGIRVTIVEPGFFKTNLANAARSSSEKIEDYNEIRARANCALRERSQKGEDPILVSQLILKILKTEKPKLHYAVGKDKSGLLFKRFLPQSTFEGQLRRIFRLDDENKKT